MHFSAYEKATDNLQIILRTYILSKGV